MAKRKHLAVSSEADSQSDDSSAPLASLRLASTSKDRARSKGKGKEKAANHKKQTRKSSKENSDEDQEEFDLIEDHRAGLVKANGKGKEKEVSSEKVKGKGKQQEVAKRRVLAVDEDDDDDADDEEAETLSFITESIGTLHDSSDEEGLGRWTLEDGEMYQGEEQPEPNFVPPKNTDGSDAFEVDIVVRWRWHPRRHFPQYRVKWTGYSDVFNQWLPISNFDGDLVDHFWKDLEHAGIAKRGVDWDKVPEDEEADTDDTERAVMSKDGPKRRKARKRKRKDIRADRKEMRKAYARKNARKQASIEKKEQMAEARRKKKEEVAAMAAAASNASVTSSKSSSKKTVINPAQPVKRMEPARPSPTTPSASKGLEVSKPINNGSIIANSRSEPVQEKTRVSLPAVSSPLVPSAPSSSMSDKRAIMAAYVTESDAKLKADKKKAKIDEAMRKGHLSISPSSSEAEIPKPGRPSTSLVNAKGNSSGINQSTDERTKGAFRGAHKNIRKTKTLDGNRDVTSERRWDPLSIGKPSSNGSTSARVAQPQQGIIQNQSSVNGSMRRVEQPLTSSQTAMPPPMVFSSTSNGNSGFHNAENDGAIDLFDFSSQISPTTSSHAPATTPTISNAPMTYIPPRPLHHGPFRMGHDPRSSRPMQRPASNGEMPSSYVPQANSATGSINSPVHSNQSPMHNVVHAQSPNHTLPSPIHGNQYQPQNLAPSPVHMSQSARNEEIPNAQANSAPNTVNSVGQVQILGLKPIERERAENAMRRWRINDRLQNLSNQAYNFQPRYPNEDPEQRRVMQHIISVCGGGRPSKIEDKHKQAGRTNIVWIPSARNPLSAMEREALPLTNFKFIEYDQDSGALEIWPFVAKKMFMYTFGALMHKLVDQCYNVKSKEGWSNGDGVIMIHPWQKTVLQQLIDSDMLHYFLRNILEITEDITNVEFAVTDLGKQVLDDFEEVPMEYLKGEQNGREEPLVTELDLSDHILSLDKETSATLHRLQYQKRQYVRFFTLIMGKTRLTCSEVPTLYRVVQ